nr:hypothetical protein [Tanacetum cinerariifolium]
MEYAPTVTPQQQSEFSQLDSGLTVLVFKQSDDPIYSINHMMSFLSVVITHRFPITNNQLMNSSNPRQQATINDGRVTLKPVLRRKISFCYGTQSKQCTKPKSKRDNSWFKDKVLMVQAQANGQILHEEELAFLANPGIPEVKRKGIFNANSYSSQNDFKQEESRNIDRGIALEKKIKHMDNIVYKRDQSAQIVHMLTKPKFFYDHTTKQALGFQNPFYLKKAQQLKPKLYDGNVIKNTCVIVISNSEETLMLAEESRSKMILKQQDPVILEKKFNTTPVDYVVLNQLS